jgi:hypothetical protein
MAGNGALQCEQTPREDGAGEDAGGDGSFHNLDEERIVRPSSPTSMLQEALELQKWLDMAKSKILSVDEVEEVLSAVGE